MTVEAFTAAPEAGALFVYERDEFRTCGWLKIASGLMIFSTRNDCACIVGVTPLNDIVLAPHPLVQITGPAFDGKMLGHFYRRYRHIVGLPFMTATPPTTLSERECEIIRNFLNGSDTLRTPAYEVYNYWKNIRPDHPWIVAFAKREQR